MYIHSTVYDRHCTIDSYFFGGRIFKLQFYAQKVFKFISANKFAVFATYKVINVCARCR